MNRPEQFKGKEDNLKEKKSNYLRQHSIIEKTDGHVTQAETE